MVAIGSQLKQYKIISQLGAGGMGEVYLAHDSSLDRNVAIKILSAKMAHDVDLMRRFLQEAKAASALNHPNVTHIYEIVTNKENCFIVMEYVEGKTLDAIIDGKPLDTDLIIDVGIQVADALDEAHARGITHRDIKPANIMISTRGVTKILDFGLAKLRHSGESLTSEVQTLVQTDPGVILGTPPYMSPEQAMGKTVDHRTDIFSLGVMLYEMATGKRPFIGKTMAETINQITNHQPEAILRFNYNLPKELERIIRKCLEKSCDSRYQSMKELLIDLKNLKRDNKAELNATINYDQANADTLVQTAQHRNKKQYNFIIFLAMTVLMLGFVGLYYFLPHNRNFNSIAVLPLINASADTEYLSDGITENIIHRLSQIQKLKVMARSTVFSYKGKEIDPRKIGHELKVDTVLISKIVQQGDNLIITTELVDVTDGSEIWGERYNRKLADLLVIEEEIAEQISENLRLKLSGEEKNRLSKHYTLNVDASKLYLYGRFFLNKRTADGINKAIENFQKAIEKDPQYALAYDGLADCYFLLPFYQEITSSTVYPKAKEAVMKALAIDDTLAEAHVSLANIKHFDDWDFAGAEKEFHRAIEINPNDPSTHQWYSVFLSNLGRSQEALVEAKIAHELDPLSPIINAILGKAYGDLSQFDQAFKDFHRLFEIDPNFGRGHELLAGVYLRNGMMNEAAQEFIKAYELYGDDPQETTALHEAFALSGWKGYYEKQLEIDLEHSKRGYKSPVSIACDYAMLDDKNHAFELLEKAYKEHSPFLTDIKCAAELNTLHSDPRYDALLNRIGLTP